MPPIRVSRHPEKINHNGFLKIFVSLQWLITATMSLIRVHHSASIDGP